MNNESNLVLEIWEVVRDLLPAAKRLDTANALMRCFVEYGFDERDLQDLIDEDPYLTKAYRETFEEEEEEEEHDDYNDE